MSAELPPAPDFQSLYDAAKETTDQRTRLLALMGNLSFMWSNNESMFIYVVMLLLGTDEPRAAIVFSTLNTTRARLELVQRLSKMRIPDRSMRKKLEALIERFNAANRLRNELNHATFMLDEQGNITHTNSMRIIETKGNLRFGEMKPIDEERLSEISNTVVDLIALNRDIWDFLPRLKAYLEPEHKTPAAKPKAKT